MTAKVAGKTKLIIELQSNGGGRILLGYDAFKQLFPNLDLYGGSILHAHDGLNFIGQGLNDLIQNSNQAQLSPQQLVGHFDMNYKNDLTANGTVYNSWKELYGPQEAHGDKFTSIVRLKLDSPDLSLTLFPHINVTGFNNRKIFTKPPFALENIILLTDGFCTSTYTLFAEFMKTEANVTSIVFGGRPQMGPMQAIGGSKGAEVMNWSGIYGEAALVIAGNGAGNISPPTDDLQPVSSFALSSPSPPLSPNLPFPSTFPQTQSPHPVKINDVSEMWWVAAQTAWGGKSICVSGCTGDKSSLTGMGRVDNGGFTSTKGAVVVTGTTGNVVQSVWVTPTGTAPTRVKGAVGRGVGWVGMIGIFAVAVMSAT